MKTLRFLALSLVTAVGACASAGIRFSVHDTSGRQTPTWIIISSNMGQRLAIASNASAVDIANFQASKFDSTDQVIDLVVGDSKELHVLQQSDRPVKEIVIRVTATRIPATKASLSTGTNVRDRTELQKFVNTASSDSRNLTKGQSGVAEDSAGQQHVRGEHADISYVVDGVPMPDALSGRQGNIVVPSTIQSLEILTGMYAPEFGGQTAAILNISTLPKPAKGSGELNLQYGSYNSITGDLTALGLLNEKASYVFAFNSSRTDVGLEPPQPNNPDVHNQGSSSSAFSKLRWTPSNRDTLTLTVSYNPDDLQIANRTGLPSSFAPVGQGYGLFGMRNADGTRPDINSENAGKMGSETIVLPSQQEAGQKISQKEIGEYAVLSFDRKLSAKSTANLALTVLHSGQEVTNSNPTANVLSLPVDSSIEFNPTATRNVHQLQLSGNYALALGTHKFKAGFLLDAQSGNESYQVIPASRLALNALAALAPSLAPAGYATTDVDVNGNPVYVATSNAPPILQVSRVGTYKAGFAQDTWQISRKFVANFGFRMDWYSQNQNLGQPSVNATELSPRFNFQYSIDKLTDLSWAYNHLFNTPPLAQGAVIGEAIQPEILDQYDIGVRHKLGKGQTVGLAYYYKDIHNQTDTGLMIPGSQIGLFSSVSLQSGGVHGVEFSYEISAPKSVGWDGYLNYTYGAAKPNGVDNTGERVDDYNDHDQRQTVGLGLAYTAKSGASGAITVEHGSGLASSVVTSSRTPRTDVGLHLSTGDRLFHGHGGISVDVQNLFDSRDVINFQSAFSGTRFQIPRRISLQANFKF